MMNVRAKKEPKLPLPDYFNAFLRFHDLLKDGLGN